MGGPNPLDVLLNWSLVFGFRSRDSRRRPGAAKEHGGFVVFEPGRGEADRRTRRYVNDPSAGSPTETLLRLLLPLNDQV